VKNESVEGMMEFFEKYKVST